MNIKSGASLFLLLLLHALAGHGQNPVIKDTGMSDPHVRVFQDTLYLYSGHDAHPDDKTWVMKDWRVFASTDLLDWKLVETISPQGNYMDDNSPDCWAGDAATRNGTYYFYFSDRKRGIGVMSADRPDGPFQDALGKPLVSPLHDPTILFDDDESQTPYIFYGDKSDSYYVAKLNDDMISLAEAPRPLEVIGSQWEAAPEWMDKNYVFKKGDTYYLSWGRDYAISKNIYGPYECAGSVGNGHHLSEYAHGSFFAWKGQFYHIWCYYLRDGYKYRESIISYCHIDEQGAIVTDTDFLDQHFANGVGQYDASWPKIEAEWYYEISPGIRKQGKREDGFVLTDIQDGSWVKFANMNMAQVSKQFAAYASLSGGKGNIAIRLDSPQGPLLGKIKLSSTNGTSGLQRTSTKLNKVLGKRDVFLTFSCDQQSSFSLDWFRFLP